MKKVRWAVVGIGGIADRRPVPAILKDDIGELVAVMDRVEEVAREKGEKYGVPYFVTEAEMLRSVECDAVYIGTPVACHYEQAMLALQYGKHVFIEKPLAMNEAQARAIVDAFRAAGKQITVGYMMKHHNLHEKAKTLIAADGIGEVNTVRVGLSCWYPAIAGAWRQNPTLGGGGAIMDLGVHCVELVEYLLDDEIDEVKALYHTRTFSYEVEDGGVIIFRTKGGVLGHIDVNFNVPDLAAESKLELYGTKGYIICRGTLGQEEAGTLSHLYAPQGDYSAMQSRTTSEPVTYAAEGADLYLKQIHAFSELLTANQTDYTYADRAVQVQGVIDRIYRN